MKSVSNKMKEKIELGMKHATHGLVHSYGSPVLLGGSIGVIYFVDGETPGFNFVSDVQYAADFNETGCPKELWLAFGAYLRTIADAIDAGQLDSIMKPLKGDVDGNA